MPIKNYKIHKNDKGSTQIQIVQLTLRVSKLSEHLKRNKKDYSSQRGLKKILGKRKRLLKYFLRKDPKNYQSLITKLGIRTSKT